MLVGAIGARTITEDMNLFRQDRHLRIEEIDYRLEGCPAGCISIPPELHSEIQRSIKDLTCRLEVDSQTAGTFFGGYMILSFTHVGQS